MVLGAGAHVAPAGRNKAAPVDLHTSGHDAHVRRVAAAVGAVVAGRKGAPPSGIARLVYCLSRPPRDSSGGGLRPSRARGPFVPARATTLGP